MGHGLCTHGCRLQLQGHRDNLWHFCRISVRCIEYAVQGKFRRSIDDTNGVHGCWYVPLKKLVRAIGKVNLAPILEAYEHDLAEARAEALEQIDEADESGDEGCE